MYQQRTSPVLYLIAKAVISGIIIVAAAKVAERSPLYGAFIVSLPLVSILTLVWLWRDTADSERVAALSEGAFLAGATDSPDVLRFSAHAEAWISILARARPFMRAHGNTLCSCDLAFA